MQIAHGNCFLCGVGILETVSLLAKSSFPFVYISLFIFILVGRYWEITAR